MTGRPEHLPETAFDAIEGVEATLLSRTATSGVRGFETLVLRLEIAAGALLPRHSHPGDEHLVMLQDGVLTAPDGARTPLARGQHVLFPAGRAHGNVRSTSALAMIATVIMPQGALFLRFETEGQ